MAVIEVNHLGFCYQDHHQSFRALDDMTVKINDGEFVCVIGPSGCGKTTFLRLLAGLHLPTEGSVAIDGRQVTRPGTDRAIVFQNGALFPWMKARENVQFGIQQARKGLKKAQVREIADALLDKVSMLESADKYPYQLSGGMLQRVAIARALAMDTDILLLDEPFGALDVKIRGELQVLLNDLWQSDGRRKTVVFITHDIGEAVYLADRILLMAPGKVLADCSVDLPRPRNALSAQDKARMESMKKELLLFFDQNPDQRPMAKEMQEFENEAIL